MGKQVRDTTVMSEGAREKEMNVAGDLLLSQIPASWNITVNLV
jgi:hypothetical protein